jgi:hypothetical protein
MSLMLLGIKYLVKVFHIVAAKYSEFHVLRALLDAYAPQQKKLVTVRDFTS